MELKRSYFNKLLSEITDPEISILVGARQVGKSTLLRSLQTQAEKKGYRTHFYNLELSTDLQELSGDQKSVLNQLTKNGQVVFIDEFHYLPNAFKIFKALFDSKAKVKIYASGSSSIEIHKHLKESLAGRFTKTFIQPLSWTEFQTVPHATFSDYCVWGGLPGLLHRKNHDTKLDLLENIVSTYITKDVKALIKEENIRAFNSMLYLLAQAQGQVTVVANLARETGLTEATIARHLEILSQTYVAHVVTSYSANLANELKKSKKYYLYDLGIRNHLLKDYRPVLERKDQGAILESFVYLHLLRQIKPNMEIRFWRTKKGNEVDFIVIKNRIPFPIEVKSKLQKPEIPASIKMFLDRYSDSPGAIVFNESLKEIVTYKEKPVQFLPWQEAVKIDYLQSML